MITREIKIIIDGDPMLFKSTVFEDGYFVSKCGKVYSTYSDKVLSTRVSHNGYERVTIRRKKYYVHRLVAQSWVGNVGNGNGTKIHVDHIDADRLNNNANNLRIINRRDNLYKEKNKLTGAHKTSGGKWMAQIRVNSWLQYLGTYDTQEKARARYNIARMFLNEAHTFLSSFQPKV